MLDLADRLGAATLATGHYARAHARRPAARAPPTRPRTRATCSPRSAAPRSPACASRSASCTRPQVRELARERRPAGREQARLAGPLLPGRHGPRARSSPATAGCASGPGDIVDRAGRVLGRHRGHHGYTVGQRRGLGIGGAASRSTCSPPTRAPTPSRSGRATALATTHASRVRGLRLHRDGAERRRRAAALPRARGRACRLDGRRRSSLGRAPFDGVAPGPDRRACCDGRRRRRDARTIAAMAMTSDEIRETFLSFFEAARPPAPARRRRWSPRRSTRRCCSRPPACTRSSPTSSGQETPPRRA